MGDFMAMPIGTGPSKDDLFAAVKNWRNCCPTIPKPRMLPGKKKQLSIDTLRLHFQTNDQKNMSFINLNMITCYFQQGFRLLLLYTIIQTVPCICCISMAPCSMGLGLMMVVWVAWHRLTILGLGAVCGAPGMALGNKKHTNITYICILQTPLIYWTELIS